jgi:hypothetical protein
VARGAPAFREADLGYLRNWRDNPRPVDEKDKAFMRLWRMGLVTGAIDNSTPGEPKSVIRLTPAGQRKLQESVALAHVASL